jgi:hypothetical protein
MKVRVLFLTESPRRSACRSRPAGGRPLTRQTLAEVGTESGILETKGAVIARTKAGRFCTFAPAENRVAWPGAAAQTGSRGRVRAKKEFAVCEKGVKDRSPTGPARSVGVAWPLGCQISVGLSIFQWYKRFFIHLIIIIVRFRNLQNQPPNRPHKQATWCQLGNVGPVTRLEGNGDAKKKKAALYGPRSRRPWADLGDDLRRPPYL